MGHEDGNDSCRDERSCGQSERTGSRQVRHGMFSRATRVTPRLRQSFTLYSGGRDKAVHEWRGSAWQAPVGDGLVFAGNVLPPSCGDVVLALAAHGDSGTVVAGSKSGCVQAWRGGRADGSSSVGHGQVNALQVRRSAAAVDCTGTGTYLCCSCLAATTCWRAAPTDASSR